MTDEMLPDWARVPSGVLTPRGVAVGMLGKTATKVLFKAGRAKVRIGRRGHRKPKII